MPKMQKTSAAKAAQRNAIVERRRQISLLLGAGLTQAQIAAQLGTSEATISADLTDLRAALTRESLDTLGPVVERECAQLDADEAALRTQLYDRGGRIVLSVYDRIMSVQDRRARWRGFEQAPKGRGSLLELDLALQELGLT